MEEFDKKTITDFLEISTDRQLAAVLNTSYKSLKYNLYKIQDENKYKVFEIKKRNGGTRQICAPISRIKYLQKNISEILNHLHKPKYCAHGYVIGKSIKTNAEIHVNKRIVINIDLKNFFPSINFGGVRGLFQKYPFTFDSRISTILAQICCINGALPQGAPSSPIISNYICWRLDNQLLSIARKNRIHYTRYADDITFSTNLKELPKEIGTIDNGILYLSATLINIIENNGFSVNSDKIRFALKNNRQEVTGLIVNEKVNINRKYIRHVRAMLNAWEKYGLDEAAREHFEKYNYKNKIVNDYSISFKKELSGKIGYIGHIKGKEDGIYRKIYKRIKALDPEIKIPIPQSIIDSNTPIVICEGKTDGMHLSSALSYFKSKGEFVDLEIYFFPYEKQQINNTRLLNVCENRNIHKEGDRVEVYLFDRDVPNINDKISETPLLYKSWGKNIYSLLLPIPSHRVFEEICIEHYYTDDEIKTETKKGWRIYLSDEFDKQTGNHLTNAQLKYSKPNYLRKQYPVILDNNVVEIINNRNVALSKFLFAKNIKEGIGNFKNISFENFRPIFQELKTIIDNASIP